MCNGHSSRTSQGGSIAILVPTEHHRHAIEHTTLNEEWQLLFSNDNIDPSSPGTQVQLKGWNGRQRSQSHGYWVVIHRDGDLREPAPPNQIPTNTLFTFSLDEYSSTLTKLPRQLDITVGDTGIIGRRVSVMTSSTKGPLPVAVGIIGWN
ncbi:hypothetical protein BCR34DRAFT_496691 [Clohesyomyces aquaticus]|uniref:Uncharacterized protein n=1 Tax=Clohesyomyces aquaticus TaxID=1231657 RepID=A0A1Y1YI34_9PLEO|nr:hypothetical protein BCR34DRAFT_496691 [Clohesyomyces aquaticus]